MQKKPLLLTIPCFFILALLLLIDSPLSEPSAASADENLAKLESRKEDALPAENSEKKKETTQSKKDKEQSINMNLVVGLTGDLKKGGFEPVYETPNTESEVIAKLQYHCTVVQLTDGSDDEWIHVDLQDKGDGYVLKENVELMPVTFTSDDPVRMGIIIDALKYLGLPFVRYGKSLETGIDCSNFIQQIYKMNGLNIPNEPKKQRDKGIVIPSNEAKPGDIIFYDRANNGYGHVGIFLGSGFVINSSGHSGKKYPEGGVRIVGITYKDRDHYEVVSYLQAAPDTELDEQLKEAQEQSGGAAGQTSDFLGTGDEDDR